MSQVENKFLKETYVKANGTTTVTADISLNSHKLTNVTDPTSNQDASTKKYVDDTVGALSFANTTLSNLGTTAINASLLAGVGALDVGSTGIPFANGYFDTVIAASALQSSQLNDTSAIAVVGLDDHTLQDNTGGTILDFSDAGGMDFQGKEAKNLLNPVSAQSAATKNYVDTAIGAITGESRGKQSFTLSGTDITNQYVDLSQVILASSLDFMVDGLIFNEGVDYSVNLTGGAGGKTRVTFLGDLATGGPSALVATDVVYVKYEY